jgi:DegV family protein with EDD domain
VKQGNNERSLLKVALLSLEDKMAKVKVVTDSAAELSPEVVERLGITVVPLTLHFDDEVLRDGLDITPQQFYRKLEYSSTLPFSSPPPMTTFQEVYTELSRTTDQIISIHVSNKLNRTVDVAQAAVDTLISRCRIAVVDSSSLSLGLGTLVSTAAEAAAQGMSLDSIIRQVRGMIPRIYIIFFVETLEYLEREERIGKAQAILGTMLDIKPILIVEDGEIIPLEKVRTRAKAIDKLFEFVVEFSHIQRVAILQSVPNEDSLTLIERLEMLFPKMQFPVITYGPVLATYIGPDAMGVIVYEGMD